MALEQKDKPDLDEINPDNPEWYDQTLKDIQSLPETEEPGQKSIAEQEADTSTSDGSSKDKTKEEKKSDESKSKDFENNTGQKQEEKSKKGFFSRNKGKFAVGAGGGLALSVVGLAAFLPQIMTNIIIDKLSDTFMGRAKYAIQQRAERYTSKYVTKVIGGELQGTCGTTVNRSCVEANSLMGRLTEQWRSNRLEERLFKNHGIEFELDRTKPNSIRVLQNGVPIDGDGDFGKRSVVNKVIDVVDTETKFDGIVTRRHIRSVLARKYGAQKFCIIACDKRDSLETRRLNALKRLKLKIYSQVAEIGASRTSAYLLCLTVNCSDADLKKSESDAIDNILARQSDDFIKELADDVDELTPGSRNLSNLVTKRIVEKLLAKVVTETTAKAAASSIPLVGQIYFAATAIEIYTVLEEKLEDREISKYMRQINSQEAALWATQILNIDDDNQSQQASLEDRWATFQLLNGFGESRLWQEANGIEQKSTIECRDGVVLSAPEDPLVCPELKVQPTLAIEEAINDPTVSFIRNFANQYNFCLGEIPGTDTCTHPRPRTIIRPTLNIINGALGFAGDALLGAIGAITPGFNAFKEAVTNFVADYANRFFSWASEKALKRVIDVDAEDQLALDQTALGLDVLGNQFGRGDPETPEASSIEGSVLTGDDQAKIDLAIYEDKKEKMQYESVFARYFDINNHESLAGSTTLAIATGLDNNINKRTLPSFNLASIFSNVSTALGFQENSYAALGPQDRFDLFGVTQYGCPIDALCTTIDPEELSPEKCLEFEQARLDSAFENTVTGETDYLEENPCALDEIVIDSYTKLDNLDSASGANPTSTVTGPVGIPAGFIEGTPIPGQNTSNIPCPSSPNVSDLGIENEAYISGTRYSIRLCSVHGVRINSIVAQSYDEMFTAMKAAGYTISGSAGFRDMASQIYGYETYGSGTYARPGYSNHQFGTAVDISCQGNGQSYTAGTGRYREAFLAGVSQYPCLEWVASNSQNYNLLLQCIGASSSGGEIRATSGGCEWWHISPTGG